MKSSFRKKLLQNRNHPAKSELNEDYYIKQTWLFLSVPVDVGLGHFARSILDKISERNTIVFDVGSTKLPICECDCTTSRK